MRKILNRHEDILTFFRMVGGRGALGLERSRTEFSAVLSSWMQGISSGMALVEHSATGDITGAVTTESSLERSLVEVRVLEGAGGSTREASSLQLDRIRR